MIKDYYGWTKRAIESNSTQLKKLEGYELFRIKALNFNKNADGLTNATDQYTNL